MKTFFEAVLDLIYPPKCIACKVILPLNELPRFICDRCAALFEPITTPICKKCGIPVETEVEKCASCFGKTLFFDSNRAAFIYDELIRDLMHEIKFRERKRYAVGIAKLWARTYTKTNFPFEKENAVLVPLPMHPDKQKERGFNQSDILASELSIALNIPKENALVRILDTPPQSGLHPKLRAENVSGVFEVCNNFKLGGKTFILIDDIYTTGASLNECAKTLKNAGANNVFSLTFAITEKNRDKT